MIKNSLIYLFVCVAILSCKNQETKVETTSEDIALSKQMDFDWKAANVYFLLTDRFNNGDTFNDVNFDRTRKAGKLRDFQGGDIKGITQKIKEGYFTHLGVNAIWLTPINEQIHGATDEGTGLTYGYHGYWIKDWTAIDPNFGTKADLKEMVTEAHKHGIRVLLDAVINHTGPVTEKDPVWPESWVRTQPQCTYKDYETTVTCTLVKNLPDIKTESDENVELPPQLVEKWKAEGRYEQEVAELDAFFKRTGYPRAPRYYIIKWLTDYITEFGVDGYRCDTVKHTEESVWQEFRKECDYAFAEFKKNNPDKVIDDNNFFLVAEVYNYGISGGKDFSFGDKKVNYFDNAFDSSINFEFKWNAKQMTLPNLFTKYDKALQSDLKDYTVLNYLTSHDDGQPFDRNREKAKEAATILLLSPGQSQIYYGDEMARPLVVEGIGHDADLRSSMNWEDVNTKKDVLEHWQKLGQFRAKHPAVGAGKHAVISKTPYVFSRVYQKENTKDAVIIALLDSDDAIEINVSSIFKDGQEIKDAYSGKTYKVNNGKVKLNPNSKTVLLEIK